MDNLRWSRREFLAFGFPFVFWRRKRISIADIPFRIVRNGKDRRRYIWIHGNERTARDVLLAHMQAVEGRAFLIENNVRNATIGSGVIDPNRMFSRFGAEQNLRRLNPGWNEAQFASALVRLGRDRENFVGNVLPGNGGLIVALHNNSEGYSVKDEVPISDATALNNPEHPHEFMLCTMRRDFEVMAGSPFNVVLQNSAPKEDDGSLSRLAAARGVRYVNIEAALGNVGEQTRMLTWLEEHLS
jgi:hypothetical protein